MSLRRVIRQGFDAKSIGIHDLEHQFSGVNHLARHRIGRRDHAGNRCDQCIPIGEAGTYRIQAPGQAEQVTLGRFNVFAGNRIRQLLQALHTLFSKRTRRAQLGLLRHLVRPLNSTCCGHHIRQHLAFANLLAHTRESLGATFEPTCQRRLNLAPRIGVHDHLAGQLKRFGQFSLNQRQGAHGELPLGGLGQKDAAIGLAFGAIAAGGRGCVAVVVAFASVRTQGRSHNQCQQHGQPG